METVSPLGIAAVVLGGVLIGVGILLVVAGFIITNVVKARPTPPGPAAQTSLWDFAVALAERVQLIYIPGILMIVLGIVLVSVVVLGADPFMSGGPDATPSPGPSAAPTAS